MTEHISNYDFNKRIARNSHWLNELFQKHSFTCKQKQEIISKAFQLQEQKDLEALVQSRKEGKRK